MTDTDVLTISRVSVSHGALPAVRHVDLGVPSGRVTCVIGPNGAGKSSLVGAIAGWYGCEGSILLDGQDLSGLPTHRRARAGLAVVPETSTLFPLMTVRETLELASTQARNQEWDQDRLLDLFPTLAAVLRSRVANLSGGERQMLAIGKGLTLGPRVLVLDEPSAGLAPIVCGAVGKALNQLVQGGLAVCIFEQSLILAQRTSTHAVRMARGRLTEVVELKDAQEFSAGYFGQHTPDVDPGVGTAGS